MNYGKYIHALLARDISTQGQKMEGGLGQGSACNQSDASITC